MGDGQKQGCKEKSKMDLFVLDFREESFCQICKKESSVVAETTLAWLLVVYSEGCIPMSHRLRITSARSCHLKNGVELLLKPQLIHQSDTRIYDHRLLLCIEWA